MPFHVKEENPDHCHACDTFHVHLTRKILPLPTPFSRSYLVLYLRMEEARRLRRSAFWALASVTRLARVAAYSACECLLVLVFAMLVHVARGMRESTYGSILGGLGVTALEGHAVTLVLEALGGDQTLDLGGLGVWLLALTLWLHLTTDDKLADLDSPTR